MWIKIRAKEGPNLSIPVPLFMASFPFVWKLIAKAKSTSDDTEGEERLTNEWSGNMEKLGPQAVSELRSFVRRNGHFTMVDIESADGDIVKITV